MITMWLTASLQVEDEGLHGQGFVAVGGQIEPIFEPRGPHLAHRRIARTIGDKQTIPFLREDVVVTGGAREKCILRASGQQMCLAMMQLETRDCNRCVTANQHLQGEDKIKSGVMNEGPGIPLMKKID